jgi:hypothetical protein
VNVLQQNFLTLPVGMTPFSKLHIEVYRAWREWARRESSRLHPAWFFFPFFSKSVVGRGSRLAFFCARLFLFLNAEYEN